MLYQREGSRERGFSIANIRNAKMRKLQEEKENWQNAFAKGRSVVPDVKHILTVRVNG